jgi:hypothetical protein
VRHAAVLLMQRPLNDKPDAIVATQPLVDGGAIGAGPPAAGNVDEAVCAGN